ncbi:MAG TPA: hypothetical protein VMW86_03475 [Dehalococcoidales bacterium]|nr:hypothetical protein [Dehalococcoidales bacterium]
MAAKKYSKYFIEYDPTWFPKERRPVMARMQDSIMKGSHFYLIHWVLPGFGSPMGVYKYAGHPPHIHKDAELLFHIGSNPDDPMDLGAEVEMYMGPELERYTFNRTCCIYIPPNFIHAPWRPIKTERPWIFIEINQGPSHTEKSYRQVLPKEARERMDWSRWPDEGYDIPA